MGTSASSKGPGKDVSYDPPWLEDINVPGQDTQDTPPAPAIGIAIKGRFAYARRRMGEYVRSGSRDAVKQALGHYSKTGMGGAQNVARRMRISTRTATNLFNTLRSLRDDTHFDLGRELANLKNRGADAVEVINAIVDHICPSGGSVDEASCRNSGTAALSVFLDTNPDADFCNLTDDQIWSLTAIYLGNEVFSRVQMDIGQAFENQDVPIIERVSRWNDLQEFIQSEVSTQLDELRNSTNHIDDLNQFLQDIIRYTFEVFEGEI